MGVGFAEKVYENALVHVMREAGLSVAQQRRITVHFDDVVIAEYAADIVVEDLVLVELKVVAALSDPHAAQCMNYLRATNKPVCINAPT